MFTPALVKNFAASLLVGTGALFLSSCGNSQLPAAMAVGTKVATTSDGSMENRIFQGINAYRAHQGIPKQARHSGLDSMAREHALWMLQKGKLEHANYEYRQGIAMQRYRIGGLAENILRASNVQDGQIPATAVQGWIESRGHRMNLESTNSLMGIGVVMGADGSFYAVHLTATPAKKSVYHPGLPRAYSNMETEHELMW